VVGDIPDFNRLLYQLGYLLYFLGRSFYWFDISATLGTVFQLQLFYLWLAPIHCVSYLDGRTLAPAFSFLRLLLSRLLFELVFSWRTELFWEERFQSLSSLQSASAALDVVFPQADVAESQFVAVA